MEPLSSDLPPELRSFLYVCFESVAQVEMVLRLRTLGRAAAVRELSGELAIAPDAARHHAETLAARGLLKARGGPEVQYWYAPATAQLEKHTDLLAEYYDARREIVIRFLTSRTARTFANAFKIRKEP